MSHSSQIFEAAPIKVQKRNGFDFSHLHVGSSYCGQLKPAMCKLLPPNTDFTLGAAIQVELPPLATSFFGRVDAILEGFVCPVSLLYGGWKKFISNNPVTGTNGSVQYVLPTWDPIEYAVLHADSDSYVPASYDLGQDYMNNSSLLDALGFRIANDKVFFENIVTGSQVDSKRISLLPFLCYHYIWRTYYRNPNVTRDPFDINDNPVGEVFVDEDSASSLVSGSLYSKNVGLIWHSYYTTGQGLNSGFFSGEIPGAGAFDTTKLVNIADGNLVFPDGVAVWQTRQRNYSRDYFTAASVSEQQGDASAVRFSVQAGEGEFTIAALRAANALQTFLERNNLNQTYRGISKNRWGCDPIDADFEEPYYLGRVVVPVYQKSVYQQDSTGKASAKNPFAAAGSIGTKGASGSFTGSGSITDRFHNSCWSYVMCIFSLVPHAMYAEGINRELFMTQLGDFPAPELQTLGYEEIWAGELYYDGQETPDNTTFGYIPRYSRFKYMDDEISGELRAGRTLDSFALQRFLSNVPDLNTDFLEIDIHDLDDVFAVSVDEMHLSCWYEIFFEFKVVMPLSVFCIPTLGDLQDTKTVKASVAGSRL